MSDTGDSTQNPSTNPPPLVPQSSGWTLDPATKLAPRQATGGFAPTYTNEQITAMGKEFTPGGYVGQELVDSKGVIARGQYRDDEAYNELAKLGTSAERAAFLNILAANGVYGNSKPTSTGFESRDLSAMQEAMRYANAKGVTLDVAVRLMAVDPAVKAWRSGMTGGGARIRTTAKEDLRSVFRQATAQVLGRDLSDAELERFVKSYNAAEVREATGGPAAPSVQTAAMQAAEAAAPEEAGAMKMLGYADVVDQLMKGLG